MRWIVNFPAAVDGDRQPLRSTPLASSVRRTICVSIELRRDIAHSLTIDAYRIAKRVGPGDRSPSSSARTGGRLPYYCNLQIDDGCRQMRGELVVRGAGRNSINSVSDERSPQFCKCQL